MVRFLSVAAVALLLSSAPAEEKKALAGAWTREAGAFELTFAFAKEKLTMTIMNGDNGAVITASYTVDKDGLVKLKVTKVEEKGTFPSKPPVGLEASFTWKVDGKKATLSHLAGEGTENGKEFFEGEFNAKK